MILSFLLSVYKNEVDILVCALFSLVVHPFLARLREGMERLLPVGVEDSVVTVFVGSLYITETLNHMWLHLQGDMSAGNFVGNVPSLGEWKLPVNPSSGLAERQNTVSLRQYWNYMLLCRGLQLTLSEPFLGREIQLWTQSCEVLQLLLDVNPLVPDFFFLILTHPVYKMWITQEPEKVALWNKRNFEEKKNWECAACLKYSVRIFVE